MRETVVEAQVLEVLKGHHEGRVVRFVQHGHGVVRYIDGAEVLLFLKPISKSRELGQTPLAAEVDWVSQQEVSAAYRFDAEAKPDYLDAVRGYVAIQHMPLDRRREALKVLTFSLLGSSRAPLAVSALQDLMLARDTYAIGRPDVKRLLALIEDAAVPVSVRVGLLAILDERSFVDAPQAWSALLRSVDGDDLIAVIRAARAHPSPAVNAALFELLGAGESRVSRAAAIALGTLGNDAAVKPLARLLTASDSRLRMAAIRGLGGIATNAALAQLQVAAERHADPATRRRAAAQLRVLRGDAREREPSADAKPSDPSA